MSLDGYPKVSEGDPIGNDLVCCDARGYELRSEGSSLNSCLFLGKPIDRRAVEEVQDTCDGSPRYMAVIGWHRQKLCISLPFREVPALKGR
jgi:hypothetical protein